MSGQETGERVTIKRAAEMLLMTEKTVQRYLARGLLTRIKEGNRTYLLASEVEAISQTQAGIAGQTRFGQTPGFKKPPERDVVTMDRNRYEALLIEVGELRKQVELLLEYRSMFQATHEVGRNKERELEDLRARVRVLEAESAEKKARLVTKEEQILARDERISELEAELGQFASQKPWWKR
jgi:hypothetical protein